MKLEMVRVPRRLGWPLWAVIVVCVWLALGGSALHLSSRLEQPLQLCLFKRVAGVPCPTCGFTRGALCMLHGQPVSAWLCNPLLFSALVLFFAACVSRLIFARSVKITLTRTERHAGWVLIIALLLCNWAYVIFCVG